MSGTSLGCSSSTEIENMKNNGMILLVALLAFGLSACGNNAPTGSSQNGGATSSAPAKADEGKAATNPTPAPATETVGADGQTAERIQLAKGKSDTDLKVALAPKQRKKYVAFVAKGYMTCIGPFESLDSNITIKLNGKALDLAENGPCSEHAKTAGDQVIEFTNKGDKQVSFSAPVGFHEHN